MIELQYNIKVEGLRVSIQFTKAEGYDRNDYKEHLVPCGNIRLVIVDCAPEMGEDQIYIPGSRLTEDNTKESLEFETLEEAKQYAKNLDIALKYFIENYSN